MDQVRTATGEPDVGALLSGPMSVTTRRGRGRHGNPAGPDDLGATAHRRVGARLRAGTGTGGCAVAIVAVIRSRAGEWAARWGALVVGALLFFSEASSLSLYNPWSPAVLALPFLLVMVLAAVAATGSTMSLLWAALAGSFVMQ